MRRPSGWRLLFYVFVGFSFVFALWSNSGPSDDVTNEARTEWNIGPIERSEAKIAIKTRASKHLDEMENLTRMIAMFKQGRAVKKRPVPATKESTTISLNTTVIVTTTPVATTTTASPPPPPQNPIRILIQSRFRTGSTITERYFTKHPDVFGVHEPGGMVQRGRGMRIMEESDYKLKTIKEELLDFMHDIYNCNFADYEYFFYGLNHMEYYLMRAYLTYLPRPVTNEIITPVCESKPHRLIKACRLYSTLEAERLIKEDDVKVIFLVRDPRGMAASRMKFTNIFTPSNNFKVAKGEFKLHPKMEEVIPDYCHWLEVNYLTASELPDWLKGRYLLIRYEDMENNQRKVIQQMYDFVGLPLHDDIIKLMREQDVGNNGERWRRKLRIEEVRRIQELCGDKVFRDFGYKTIKTGRQLNDTSTTLVQVMPQF
ncbi:carbohydrate sulfotransferase 1-like [Saccoglossus kowalevskii]